MLHTEEDCTYTFLKAPSQISNNIKAINYQRMRFIQLNETESIAIPFVINLLFLFKGTFQAHMQHFISECGIDGTKLYNIVSYGNKKLFTRIKKSFGRNAGNLK